MEGGFGPSDSSQSGQNLGSLDIWSAEIWGNLGDFGCYIIAFFGKKLGSLDGTYIGICRGPPTIWNSLGYLPEGIRYDRVNCTPPTKQRIALSLPPSHSSLLPFGFNGQSTMVGVLPRVALLVNTWCTLAPGTWLLLCAVGSHVMRITRRCTEQ